MDHSLFTRPAGELVQQPTPDGRASYWAFVPDGLPPPADVEANTIAKLSVLLAEAEHWLGRLVGIGTVLPNPDLLVRPQMRQEAVLSSRIEGTQTSFSDLVAYEVEQLELPGSDVREVHNYLVALDYGLRNVARDGMTADFVRELHRKLMQGARGEGLGYPGEFRFQQNHIGAEGTNDPLDARFVPPPPGHMQTALSDFFEYLRRDKDTPPLVEVAWIHYQFETIHPFNDGNGRVGRLLIPILLAHRRRLEHPLLYLSPFFERQRARYYDLLFAVSAKSDWESWLRFFLEAVVEQAKRSVRTSREIIRLGEEWQERLRSKHATPTAYRLAQIMQQQMMVNVRLASKLLESSGSPVTDPPIYAALRALEECGIASKLGGRVRSRLWIAPELWALLDPAATAAG